MDAVRAIARSVLYEGYLLWPYRRSALKNQHRFTLGGLYPAEYAETSADRSSTCVAVLVEGEAPRIDAELRFLRLWRRQAMLSGETVEVTAVPGHHPDRRQLIRVEQPSPERIEPFCQHFGSCGGCAIRERRPCSTRSPSFISITADF